MSQNSYNYATRKGIHPISWEDFHGICKALALSVARLKPHIILPVGRGGYYPGTLLGHLLQLEVYPVRVSRRINNIVKHSTKTNRGIPFEYRARNFMTLFAR